MQKFPCARGKKSQKYAPCEPSVRPPCRAFVGEAEEYPSPPVFAACAARVKAGSAHR